MKRNIGLDYCRIGAMAGIIGLHILSRGGGLGHAGEINYWVLLFVRVCMLCSVDVFAMLSGYLNGEKKSYHVYRIAELMVSLFFYSIVITAFFYILHRESFDGIKSVIVSIAPMLGGRYWYITCYFLVFFLMPYLNILVQTLDYKACQKLGFILFALCSVLPSIFNTDFFIISWGYSSLWLIVCYLWGAILKKREVSIAEPLILEKWYAVLFFICMVCVLFMKLAGSVLVKKDNYMDTYISPFIVVASFMILVIAKKKRGDCKKEGLGTKLLMGLSDSAFDVYLMHCHILIFEKVLAERFAWLGQLEIIMIPFALAASIAFIYILGTITGLMRRWIFDKFGISKILLKMCDRLDKIIYEGLSKE